MKLKRLSIAQRYVYGCGSDPNPYVCSIEIGSNETDLKLNVSEELTLKILDLIKGAVALEAEKQVLEFIHEVETVTYSERLTAIEGASANE